MQLEIAVGTDPDEPSLRREVPNAITRVDEGEIVLPGHRILAIEEGGRASQALRRHRRCDTTREDQGHP